MSEKINPNIWIPFYDKENNYFMNLYQESMIKTEHTNLVYEVPLGAIFLIK